MMKSLLVVVLISAAFAAARAQNVLPNAAAIIKDIAAARANASAPIDRETVDRILDMLMSKGESMYVDGGQPALGLKGECEAGHLMVEALLIPPVVPSAASGIIHPVDRRRFSQIVASLRTQSDAGEGFTRIDDWVYYVHFNGTLDPLFHQIVYVKFGPKGPDVDTGRTTAEYIPAAEAVDRWNAMALELMKLAWVRA